MRGTIQPLVLEGDKPRISELLKGNPETGLVGGTEDLLSLGSTDFVDVMPHAVGPAAYEDQHRYHPRKLPEGRRDRYQLASP